MRIRNRLIKCLALALVFTLLAGYPAYAKKRTTRYKSISSVMRGAVTAKTGRIYRRANTKSKVVKRLPFSTKVRTLKERGRWYYVSYKKGRKNYRGYMLKTQLVKYNRKKKHIALTFDDGPSIYTTHIVLDALEKNGCRATFFLVGRKVNEETRDLVLREKALGCEFGNHTFSHVRLTTKVDVAWEFYQADQAIKAVTGSRPALCRSPFGAMRASTVKAMKRPHILWSFDTLDWKDRDTDVLRAKVRKNRRDGGIILMHDIYRPTVEGIDAICQDLKKANYETVTVTELAAIKGKKLKAGKTYWDMGKK